MLNPRNFLNLAYVSENLDDSTNQDVLNDKLLDYLQITGLGGLEYFIQLVKWSSWTGGSILKFVLVDNSVDCKILNQQIKSPEINGSTCQLIKVGSGIDKEDGVIYYDRADDACDYIIDDIMDFDWESFMWSRDNMEISYRNISALQGISNMDKLLYYREMRGIKLPIWAIAAQELLSIQSLSLRCGVWQHYDGSRMDDRFMSVGKYVRMLGPIFRPLGDAYLSCVGKNGPSKNADKLDIFISKNEILFDKALINIYNRNKTEMESWCQ